MFLIFSLVAGTLNVKYIDQCSLSTFCVCLYIWGLLGDWICDQTFVFGIPGFEAGRGDRREARTSVWEGKGGVRDKQGHSLMEKGMCERGGGGWYLLSWREGWGGGPWRTKISPGLHTFQTPSSAFSCVSHPHNNLGIVGMEIICSFKEKKESR